MNFPETFVKSVYNIDYYRTLDKRTLGKAILYLAVISIIFGIFAMIPVVASINSELKELTDIIERNTPEFSFVHGKLVMEAESPYIVHETPGKSLIIIMDNKDSVSLASLDEYQTSVVFFSDRMHVKISNMYRTFEYSGIFADDITKENFISLFSLFKYSYIAFAFFIIAYTVLTRFMAAVIIAFLGRFSSFFARQPNITFKRAFNLACYASTLPTILSAAISIFKVQIMFSELIYILIGFLYVWWAIKKVNSQEN